MSYLDYVHILLSLLSRIFFLSLYDVESFLVSFLIKLKGGRYNKDLVHHLSNHPNGNPVAYRYLVDRLCEEQLKSPSPGMLPYAELQISRLPWWCIYQTVRHEVLSTLIDEHMAKESRGWWNRPGRKPRHGFHHPSCDCDRISPERVAEARANAF